MTAGRLLKRAGSAQAVYEMKEQELAGLLSAAQLKSFQRARKEKNVKQEYQMLLKRGIRFLPVSDPEYPARLQEIPDAPQGIYVRGGPRYRSYCPYDDEYQQWSDRRQDVFRIW